MGKACSGRRSINCCTGPTSTASASGPFRPNAGLPRRGRRRVKCAVSPRAPGRPWNEVVAGFAEGFAFLDLESGVRREIARIEADTPGLRLNDGRTDRQGRFLAAGMNEASSAPLASMWRLDADLKVTRLFGGVHVGNGTCFSPDGRTLWHADSGKGDLEAFDYEPATGALSRRRVVARTESPGFPDGACVDAEGYVWNAIWEGYRVARYAPDGGSTASSPSPSKSRAAARSAGPISARSSSRRRARARAPSNSRTRRCPVTSSRSDPACAASPIRPLRAEPLRRTIHFLPLNITHVMTHAELH